MTEIISTAVRFVQISDCHLFSDREALHYGANVFDNLCAVLREIKRDQQIEFIIFTGDLTQDHSQQSYQNFVDAVHQVNIGVRIYFLAGNHDNRQLLHQFLVGTPFCEDKVIKLADWSIHLVNSKSNTPAGYVTEQEFNQLSINSVPDKSQLVMMHHHAIDVGYFIDNHGLNNKIEFWQHMGQIKNLKGIACGHVHNALSFFPKHSQLMVPLFTCPATSIQFDQDADTVANANMGAGYRIFSLLADGTFNTQAHFIHP